MRTTGPATSAEAATAELVDIFKLEDLSARPARTNPENQEVAGEEEEEEDEIEEVREGFIALYQRVYILLRYECRWILSITGNIVANEGAGYRLPISTVDCVGWLPAHDV